MTFLPPLPKDPDERRAFIDIYQRELRQFRRRPSYIAGIIMALLSGLTLVYLGDSTIRLIMLPGMLGVSFIFDTVTRHFCTTLLSQSKQPSPQAASHTDPI